MIINRIWAMPNKKTFLVPAIRNILIRYNVSTGWADPFANDNSPAEFTNDLNPNTKATKHMEVYDFLKEFDKDSLNGVLLDPPYSMHQVTASYDGYGEKRINSLTPVYDESARIIKNKGYVISFGWNSNGIGAKRGFKIIEIVLIAHGGRHNDTIVTIEQKDIPKDLFY